MIRFVFAMVAPFLVAAAPAPVGYVNDLANVIPDDREALLEKKLSEYAEIKFAQISVVTTPSLDGENIKIWSYNRFNDWGIGQKGRNNGLLVVIAPNERKYRTEVGSGLEGILTDGQTGTLQREILVPAFKQKDYASGIDKYTDALIISIEKSADGGAGTTPNSLVSKNSLSASDKALRIEAILEWLAIIFVAVGGLSVLWKIRKVWKRFQEKRELQRERDERLNKSEEKFRFLHDQSLGISAELANLPRWIEDEYIKKCTQTAQHSDEAHSLLWKAALAKRDAPEFDKQLSLFDDKLFDFEDSLGFVTGIWQTVEGYREDAANVFHDAETKVRSVKELTSKLRKTGFNLSGVITLTDETRFEETLENINALLVSRESGVADNSDQVIQQTNDLLVEVTPILATLETIATRVQSAKSKKTNLIQKAKKYGEKLGQFTNGIETLRRWVPQERLDPFATLKEKLVGGPEKIVASLASITKDQFQEITKLGEVEVVLLRLQEELELSENVFQRWEHFAKNWGNSKKNYRNDVAKTESVIRNATTKITHVDVEKSAQQTLDQAIEKLDEANRLVDVHQPDWIAIKDLLESAQGIAQTAIHTAERHISNATIRRANEKRQQDQIERLARRRQEEEEDRRRERDDGSDFSSVSFGSSNRSSSSDNDTFGGFGGGSSSGGGSDGGWDD